MLMITTVVTIICVGARWSLCWGTGWSTRASEFASSRIVSSGVSDWLVLFSMASMGSTHSSIVGVDHPTQK